MFRNNFLIAIRHMRHRMGFSVLNILGMALGLASSVLLINFLVGQWSFDRFHSDSDRIYRLVAENKVGTEEETYPNVPPRIGYDLTEMMPEVELSTRLYAPEDPMVRQGDIVFEEDKLYATDSNFFKVFDFQLLEGDPDKVLYEANRILITPEMVSKYFPVLPASGSVVGETLLLGEDRVPFLIEGVVETPPANSQIQFEMLTSMASWRAPNYFMWSYVWANTLTYVRIVPQADYEAVNNKIPDMVKTYAGETTRRIWGITYEELEARGDYINFYLQPMEDVFLHSAGLGNRVGPVGNIQVFKGLVAVAIFILLIACINFMNLSTAQAGHRAKEVGIRKTLGSTRSPLRIQFLLESLIYSGLAWLLSLGLYELQVLAMQRA
ncbi:MAG: ABC transporter permease, partial [Bacteroidota bacterium]